MGGMRVIIFGATGMVGQGVLHEALLAADVEQVLAVGRTPTGVRHPKLRELRHADFTDFTPVRAELAGYDAVFWCLGVSSAGRSEADYTRVTYDYTVAAARTIAGLNPEATFVYVSGAGTDPEGRLMWARVKGRTERAVLDLFPHGYALRPGLIQPVNGATSKTGWYRALYAVLAPALPLVRRVAPGSVPTTADIGRTMLRLARAGAPDRILESRALTG
jgi:uncharacterized protein YbjT (DUF2867 family)